MLPNAFTMEECDSMVAFFSQLNADEASMTDGKELDHQMRKSVVRWIPSHPKTENVYHRLATIVQNANAQLWNMRIDGFASDIQYAEYGGEGSHYAWHMDYGPGSMRTRKLSVSVQLSEPSAYEGGDLELATVQVPTREFRLRGTAIVFPSFLLHRVTPITRGTRVSLVAWADGPEYI